MDTWWQTETGSIMISPLPGLTRSGKIMRRLLRDIAEGREPGDATTLGDPSVLDRLPQATASEST